jgi:hypothetical protein
MNTLLLRRWHGYLGAFIAPSVIFFALTGAIQLFSLHEAHDGYRPAPIVERLSRVHKDQVFSLETHGGPPPGEAPTGSAASRPHVHPDDDRLALPTALLKWFFLVVALGLALTSTFGVLIGLTRPGGKTTTIVLMIAGAAIPLVLLVV